MKKCLLAGAIIALGAPILASAQCVAPQTPANALVGQTWAFSITGTRLGAIGQFTGFANGYLAITETVVDTSTSNPNAVSRLAPASGRWLVNAACTGGELQFMLNREFFSMTFTFGTLPSGQRTMALVGRDENYFSALAPVQRFQLAGGACVGPSQLVPSCVAPGPVAWNPPNDPGRITGTAWLLPLPRACPAGLGNPLNLLKGKTIPINYGGFAATMTFLFNNPNAYSGDIILTFNPVPFTRTSVDPPVNYPVYGRYIIYPDCSGGEFLINGLRVGLTGNGAFGNFPAFTQLEFIFIDGGFVNFRSIVDSLP